MERLNNVQRATIIAALKKELENEEKVYRQMADADILDVNAKTGAKTFEVALETDTRKVPIGTASVVEKAGSWEVDDLEAFAESARDAGQVEYSVSVPIAALDAVRDALEAAGLLESVELLAKPLKGWQAFTTEVKGTLIWKETGEPVEGAVYVPGKVYTMLRPKSADIIRDGARALYGTTPYALLEGGAE